MTGRKLANLKNFNNTNSIEKAQNGFSFFFFFCKRKKILLSA